MCVVVNSKGGRLAAFLIGMVSLYFFDCYKIKLNNAGYRLVYQVDDKRIVVIVVAVGKRENLVVYRSAGERLKD